MSVTKLTFAILIALLTSLLVISNAQAEQSVEFDDYVVHYNAINTNFIDSKVAKMYGIKRSKNRAMLTVSVLKNHIGIKSLPVEANVSAMAVNLSNQVKSMSMRKITDGGAIYYLGEFPITDKETLNFTIDVKTDNSAEKTFNFTQKFVTN